MKTKSKSKDKQRKNYERNSKKRKWNKQLVYLKKIQEKFNKMIHDTFYKSSNKKN